MTRAFIAAMLLLCACEDTAISACGGACERGGNSMASYSKADGCKCGGPLVKP